MKYSKILICMTVLVCLAFQALAQDPLGSGSSGNSMGSSRDWISPNMGQVYTRTNSDPGLAGMLQWLDAPVVGRLCLGARALVGGHEHLDAADMPHVVGGLTVAAPMPGEVGAVLQVVDHHAIQSNSQPGKDVADEIVGQRPFLGGVVQEHRDRRANAVVNVDDETFHVRADEDSASVGRREDAFDLNFDDVVPPRGGVTLTSTVQAPAMPRFTVAS
jgi:hypothetical protein